MIILIRNEVLCKTKDYSNSNRAALSRLTITIRHSMGSSLTLVLVTIMLATTLTNTNKRSYNSNKSSHKSQ